MKYFTEQEILKKYSKLTKNKEIEILYSALGHMQTYNGRSRFLCIAMAMGYRNDEGDNKSYYKV